MIHDQHHHQQPRPFVSIFVNHIKPGNAEICRKTYTAVETTSRLEPGLISYQWHIPFDVKITTVESLTRIPLMLRIEFETSRHMDHYLFRRPYVAEAAASLDPFLEAHFLTIWENASPTRGTEDISHQHPEPDGNFTSVTKRLCKPEHREKFHEMLLQLSEIRREHEGNLSYYIHVSLDPHTPNNFLEYGVWDSLDSYDAHFETDDGRLSRVLAALRDHQVEPSRTRFWKFFEFGECQTETGEFKAPN